MSDLCLTPLTLCRQPSVTEPVTSVTEPVTVSAAPPVVTAPPEPANVRPRLQQPPPPLSAVAGKPFSAWVPEDTFVDFEDGETPDLELQLVDRSSADQGPPPADSWLQFSSDDQRLYGL